MNVAEQMRAYARFVTRVTIGADAECWRWLGGNNGTTGHGKLWFDGSKQQAHRVAYQLAYGPVPPGLHVDHLCSHPWCVNPLHLEAVAPEENWRRAAERRTLCRNGHDSGRNAHGRCRQCHRDSERRRRLKQGIQPRAHRKALVESL